jgi:hypothetical protein
MHLRQLQAYPFPILHLYRDMNVSSISRSEGSYYCSLSDDLAEHRRVGATCFSMTPEDQTGNRIRNTGKIYFP